MYHQHVRGTREKNYLLGKQKTKKKSVHNRVTFFEHDTLSRAHTHTHAHLGHTYAFEYKHTASVAVILVVIIKFLRGWSPGAVPPDVYDYDDSRTLKKLL